MVVLAQGRVAKMHGILAWLGQRTDKALRKKEKSHAEEHAQATRANAQLKSTRHTRIAPDADQQADRLCCRGPA